MLGRDTRRRTTTYIWLPNRFGNFIFPVSHSCIIASNKRRLTLCDGIEIEVAIGQYFECNRVYVCYSRHYDCIDSGRTATHGNEFTIFTVIFILGLIKRFIRIKNPGYEMTELWHEVIVDLPMG